MILSALIAIGHFALSPVKADLPVIEIDAVGDIMLGRWVGRRIEREGVDSPFRSVGSTLRQADLAIGNLECVIGTVPFAVQKPIRLRAKSTDAGGLGRAGFTVLSVANNHSLDCGMFGLYQTAGSLERQKVRGVGHDLIPYTLTRKGIRVAFFAACDFHPATGSGKGIIYLDDPALPNAIRDAKKSNDIVVLILHWGLEGRPEVTLHQKQYAQTFANAGADIILGAHPHVLQPCEWVRSNHHRCLVCYSLGNFVFDARPGPECTSEILRVFFDRSGALDYQAVPVKIENGFPTLLRKPGSPKRERPTYPILGATHMGDRRI